MSFNKKIYGQLLTETLPRVIETEEENERFLKIIEGLMKKGEDNLSPEEESLLVLLCDLVGDFPRTSCCRHVYLRCSNPHARGRKGQLNQSAQLRAVSRRRPGR